MSNTPVLGHEPITMVKVEPGEFTDVGQFRWETGGKFRTLVLSIPCHSEYAPMGFQYIRLPVNCENCWKWDGNEDKPTLNPSVDAVGVWHGWIKKGKLIEHRR